MGGAPALANPPGGGGAHSMGTRWAVGSFAGTDTLGHRAIPWAPVTKRRHHRSNGKRWLSKVLLHLKFTFLQRDEKSSQEEGKPPAPPPVLILQ